MFLKIEEVKKNLEYQEKMNEDIDNIAITKQSFCIPIYEVIENSYFEGTKVFPSIFKTNVEIIQINLKTYQIKSKHIKKWLWNRGCMHKWL